MVAEPAQGKLQDCYAYQLMCWRLSRHSGMCMCVPVLIYGLAVCVCPC
jgi:hypothetical protein